LSKRGSAPGKQNLRVTCPTGKVEFKYFSSPGRYLKRFSEIPRLKLTAGEGFCEDLSSQKACVGDGGELERPLVDVTGTGKTVPSCREKRFEKKLCKRRSNSPTVVKVFEKRFGQVEEKFFESILCLFGFVKAAKFRESSKYSDCIQNVW